MSKGSKRNKGKNVHENRYEAESSRSGKRENRKRAPIEGGHSAKSRRDTSGIEGRVESTVSEVGAENGLVGDGVKEYGLWWI